MAGSQFGGAGGYNSGKGFGDDRFGYFVNPGGRPTGPTTSASPSGPGSQFGAPLDPGLQATVANSPYAGPPLSTLPPPKLLDNKALRVVVVIAVIALAAFGGFKWWHRNDPIIPPTLGGMALVQSATAESAGQSAVQKLSSENNTQIQFAAGAYGTGAQQVVLYIMRAKNLGDAFEVSGAKLSKSYGAENCLTATAGTSSALECYRGAGDLVVMTVSQTKSGRTAEDLAALTETAYRAQ